MSGYRSFTSTLKNGTQQMMVFQQVECVLTVWVKQDGDIQYNVGHFNRLPAVIQQEVNTWIESKFKKESEQ